MEPEELPAIPTEDVSVEKLRTSKAVERHERIESVKIRRQKIDLVLDLWKKESDEVKSARKWFAYPLLFALFVQGLLADVVFVLLGLDVLRVDEWTARVFIMSVFAELAAMVFFIVKYLFSRTDRDLLSLIEKL